MKFGIDSSAPMIWAASWERHCRDGWRWANNWDNDNPLGAEVAIRDYQQKHGLVNVAIGHAFDEQKMKPGPSDDTFGIYIRDVDEMIAALHKGMAEFGGEA